MDIKSNFISCLVLGMFLSILPAKNDLFKASPEHSYRLFLQTSEVVEAMYGAPFAETVFHNDGSYNEPWMKRKAMYYYSSDSSQVVTYLFDFIHSYEGLWAPLRQFFQEGDYVLISVSYSPAIMFDRHIWSDLALKD